MDPNYTDFEAKLFSSQAGMRQQGTGVPIEPSQLADGTIPSAESPSLMVRVGVLEEQVRQLANELRGIEAGMNKLCDILQRQVGIAW